MLEVSEAMCCVLLRMLEAVEDRLCLLEVQEVMRCSLFAAGAGGAAGVGGDTLCAALLAGGGGAGGARGYAFCATR